MTAERRVLLHLAALGVRGQQGRVEGEVRQRLAPGAVTARARVAPSPLGASIFGGGPRRAIRSTGEPPCCSGEERPGPWSHKERASGAHRRPQGGGDCEPAAIAGEERPGPLQPPGARRAGWRPLCTGHHFQPAAIAGRGRGIAQGKRSRSGPRGGWRWWRRLWRRRGGDSSAFAHGPEGGYKMRQLLDFGRA